MIEVIREQDELNRIVWKFWPNSEIRKVDIILDEYSIQNRPTKRHKWRTVSTYERTNRKSWHPKYQLLGIDDVPVLPSDVAEEVMTSFMATVKIKRER